MSSDAAAAMRRIAWLLSLGGAGLLVLGLAAMAWLPAPAGAPVGLALSAAAAAVGLAGAGGWIAQHRQLRLHAGAMDLFLQCNRLRSEQAVLHGSVPRWSVLRRFVAHRMFGHRWMVGDRVRVRSFDDIRATLDTTDCLDGLPFMDEMAAFCGREARVYRVVDKIYDYGRSRTMRRLNDSVLLVGLRCDGTGHGGCEAACYLIWKAQWLEPAATAGAAHKAPIAVARDGAADHDSTVYRCQYTQLSAASQPMRNLEWSRLLGPWLVGNVTAAAFGVALTTRLFNAIQAARGGLSYPWRPEGGNDKSAAASELQAGDLVRVRPPGEVARSLDKNSKNKGLWFDRDMLKHCGSAYRVRGRIRKIIDVNSGRMIPMKTACIALEDVHYSGEFQGFGEQHDYLYWREAWLEPQAAATHATTTAPRA